MQEKWYELSRRIVANGVKEAARIIDKLKAEKRQSQKKLKDKECLVDVDAKIRSL